MELFAYLEASARQPSADSSQKDNPESHKTVHSQRSPGSELPDSQKQANCPADTNAPDWEDDVLATSWWV
ncbi:MAG: hypothetical protein ACFB4J_08000 [Elainellaceae cyanobacterium]